MIKSECLVWTGEQGQQLKAPVSVHPLQSHCAFARLSCLRDISEVINMSSPAAEVRWHHASARRAGILWRHIVHTDPLNKAVSEDLGIVSLRDTARIFALLFCTHKVGAHAEHTVHELHSAAPLQEIHPPTPSHIWPPPGFFPLIRDSTRCHTSRGNKLCFSFRKTWVTSAWDWHLLLFTMQEGVLEGNASQPYQHTSARAMGQRQL